MSNVVDDFAVADLSLSVAESVRERSKNVSCQEPSSSSRPLPTTHRASVDDSISQELGVSEHCKWWALGYTDNIRK